MTDISKIPEYILDDVRQAVPYGTCLCKRQNQISEYTENCQ